MVPIVLHCTHRLIGVIHQESMAQPDSKMRPTKDGTTATLIIHLGLIVIDTTAGGEWLNAFVVTFVPTFLHWIMIYLVPPMKAITCKDILGR